MTTNQNNCWTSQRDQQLRTLVFDGRSVHAISARLKRTTGAVRSRAHFLGLSIAINKTVRNERNTGVSRVDANIIAVAAIET